MAFGKRRRGPYGDRRGPGAPGPGSGPPPSGETTTSTPAELTGDAASIADKAMEVLGGGGGGAGSGAGSGASDATTDQQVTPAPVGPPKPKPKQTTLVAAGTFSLPGAGRAAALRSAGLIRGKIGPPRKPFSGRKKRTRKTAVLPKEIEAQGGGVTSSSASGFDLDDDEYAKILAGKVINGGV